MNSLIILLLHFLLYGLSPILIITISHKYKSTPFFYSYFGFLFVFTQLFAVFYSIKISENLSITGGNIAYSSIILITLIIGIVSQDPTVIRNLILIQVFLNFFLFFLYQLLVVVLIEPTTINIFSVFSGIFTTTITVNIVSSLVFIIEVLLLFYVLEKVNDNIKKIFTIICLYMIIFIGILCLDGFLFPFIVSFFEPEFGQYIGGNILGKLILGIGFTPFLLTFIIIHKRSLALFIEKSFSLRLMIFPKRKLTEKLRKVEENLKKTEQKYEEAYNRATFYQDLFTHDISNIIQSISMSFHMLDNELKNINSLESEIFSKSLISQLNRGIRLISNIRKLANLDKEEVKLTPTDLLESLSNAINFVRGRFPQKNIKITIESDDSQIMGNVNELILDVFENLLINATNYNNNEIPEITIKISRAEISEGRFIKMEFEDNGVGIQDSRKDKIFLEGYKTLKGTKGMGIGLSLITKIINSYNGKIWVQDRIKGDHSKGSNFIVLIPEVKHI
ncbi:MAG: sensor histidine kinase [Promethearchaeota archaeon]